MKRKNQLRLLELNYLIYNMKLTKPIVILLTLTSIACNNDTKKETTGSSIDKQEKAAGDRGVLINEQSEPDTLKGSLKAYAIGAFGRSEIIINYYSPAVRGRMIWGGLVPYDQVWVTGAHKATSIEFKDNVRIGDIHVEPGKYAFFTIPGKEQWTVVLNKYWDQHLTDEYDQKEDVVRLPVSPTASQKHQERLRYVVSTESETKGGIEVYWDKLRIRMPIEVIK